MGFPLLKCVKCGGEAVVNLKPYGLVLCNEHFTEFYEKKVKEFIIKNKLIKPKEKVSVAVSGGKDSLACLIALDNLSNELNFQLTAYHINLEIGKFSKQSQKTVREATKKLDVPLEITDLKKETGFTLPELIKINRRPPCSVCGTVKRYLMNKVPRELGNEKLATGHNLDDILEFTVKNFLNNNFFWLSKLKPLLPSVNSKVLTKIKPLFERTEKENAVDVLSKGFNLPHLTCPFSRSSEWKEIIAKIEEWKPGFKLRFIKSFQKINFPVEKLNYKRCRICGELSSSEICSFCRVTRKQTGNLQELKNRK